MVGLVLVSHSRALARAAAGLARQISSNAALPIAFAGGVGADHAELGTDAMDILEAVESVYSEDGVLVLMDLGSAILSAKTAIEFLDGEKASHVSLCSAPLVEGAVAAAVQIFIGGGLTAVRQEARAALTPKQADLDDNPLDAGVQAAEVSADDEKNYLSYSFVSRLKNGLHARPASMLVSAAARFDAAVTVKNLSRNKGPEPARSINKLALLGITLGDKVEFRVSGDDSEKALDAVKKLADDNFGEAPALLETGPEAEGGLVSLAQGLAMGRLYRENVIADCPKLTVNDTEAEIRRFDAAVDRVKKDIEETEAGLVQKGHTDEAGIFGAQKLILTDEDLIDEVKKTIEAEKTDAAYVYQQKMSKLAGDYRALPGSYLPERAADINDVAGRVIAVLNGKSAAEAESTGDIILAARDIEPSMVVRFENRIRGFLSETGGATSHAAILAKTLGIPAISGYRLDENTAGGPLIIMDGKNCSVTVNPDRQAQEAFKEKIFLWEETKKRDFEDSGKNAVTTDGVKIYVRANAGEKRDAQKAVEYHAEGIGLLRTEFLFLSSPVPPDEAVQTAALKDILAFFPDDTVTIRTLDIGGDKPLPWLRRPKEDNPFLGVRGIRLCQKEQQLFITQLRAILRAAYGFKIKIMAPMISAVEEARFCTEMLEAAHAGLEREGAAHLWPVPLGIMVETPAAVLTASELAKVCGFFSIGSNDLAQYLMAAERGNPALAELASPHQCAVLRAIDMTVSAAKKADIPVSVCGEMAGDPSLSQILVGMGITELSMNPSAIGGVKRAITGISKKEAEEKALRALQGSGSGEYFV